MAVAGVGIERDVGDDADLRHGRLDGAHGAADEVAARSAPPSRAGRAAPGRCRGRARSPGCRASRRARPRAPPRRPTAARRPASRRPARARAAPSIEEERPDQVVGGERGLAHQPARPVGLAVAARALGELEGRVAAAPSRSGGLAGDGPGKGGELRDVIARLRARACARSRDLAHSNRSKHRQAGVRRSHAPGRGLTLPRPGAV